MISEDFEVVNNREFYKLNEVSVLNSDRQFPKGENFFRLKFGRKLIDQVHCKK